jgi:hypothetical protein
MRCRCLDILSRARNGSDEYAAFTGIKAGSMWPRPAPELGKVSVDLW